MLIEIKCRFSESVLFSHDIENNSIKITLEAGIKSRANLAGANLAGAYLADAYLAGAYLAGANLAGANLARAYLAGANLAGANLADANLADAYLADANLADANLARAYLAGAYLADANLADANLADANLARATYGEGVEIGENPLFLNGLFYYVYIFKAHIKIGCKLYSFDEWENFTDEEIAAMDSKATEFWSKWKTHIIGLARNK